MDLALRHGIGSLLDQRSQAGVGLNRFGSLVFQVGGTPGQRFKPFHLALRAGQVLGQLVDGRALHFVNLRLHAQQFAAVEGAQMIFFSVHLEGGQVRDAHVVAQVFLNLREVPGAADQDRRVLVELVGAAAAQVIGGIHQFLHALDGNQAVVAVESVAHGDEFAVIVGHPHAAAAGGEEEGSQVPGRSLHFESEVLLGSFAVGNQLLQGVNVFVRDDTLIIVHEVAVVRSQRIGVQLFARSGGRNRARIIVGNDGLAGLLAQGIQSAGLYKAGELILREAVDVAAGFDVGDHLGGGIRFGNSLNGSVELESEFIVGVEIGDLLFSQILGCFRNPDLDVVGFAVGGREGHHGQGHDSRQNNCEELLHGSFLLL